MSDRAARDLEILRARALVTVFKEFTRESDVQVAQRVGVHNATISRLLRDKRASALTLEQVETALAARCEEFAPGAVDAKMRRLEQLDWAKILEIESLERQMLAFFQKRRRRLAARTVLERRGVEVHRPRQAPVG